MEFVDGQEAEELLQEYMTKAPEDIQKAWAIRERSYMALIAEVARLASRLKELGAPSLSIPFSPLCDEEKEQVPD
jgi:hypothetical protein